MGLDRLHRDPRCVSFSPGFESAKTENENIVVIFEDKALRRVRDARILRSLGGPDDRRQHIVMLRDPYNLTASRLRRWRTGRRGTPPKLIDQLWPRHARAGEPWTKCVYNRWFTDEVYRSELAQTLGLASCPELPQTVPVAGKGSSFDGLAYDGRAAEMSVLDRWKDFADDGQYRRLIDHPQQARLSEEVCGFPNPMEEKTS